MGRTLSRASLPRDASGQVDLEAVGRSLSALRGTIPSRPTTRVRSAILLADLEALGGVPAPAVATNGHAVEPAVIAQAEVSSRPATMTPAAPPMEVAPVRGVQLTDVRGIGRILPAPVNLEDLEGSASMRAPSAGPASDSPVVEAAAEDAVVVVQEDVDLGSFPPLDDRMPSQPAIDPRPSALPAPLEPMPSPPVARPPSAAPAAASTPSADRRPTHASMAPVMSTRMSYASLLPVSAPSVAPAEVGASFDEFLGSAPVEPTPRTPPPLSIPRAMPAIPALPRRATMQVPLVRVPTGMTSGSLPRVPVAPTVAPPVVEAVESLEVDDVVEVEEIAPAPLLSRPPALPPLPPKKR